MREQPDTQRLSVGAWTKRCYFAGRAVMDATLRPYDLGSTQWYVLWYLANNGPSVQRDLARALELERATLSGIVATLVRKELVEQSSSGEDQRQRLLRLTAAGEGLWRQLPDLSFIHEAAFGDADETELATTIRVLKSATERLQNLLRKDLSK
ncbi:MarR family transcriptional regulator [Kaistia dalseonensis]|uniref:DNA-binding MarR family transcriptional regulator n=1 Tax=Kaistia dalseonensis TaxID=410840 RepID=A0ABU0H4X4_9HYPH|nr:MarR family transcriptional regulator [Kaistia dalseonensis]MCX5493950.1 MarR family transcriptional regulator [Kaistia dalseonensis]MDQ0436526.1 DNA-binding MarR family transcriptional regulator [Kaistia dalseonensis]